MARTAEFGASRAIAQNPARGQNGARLEGRRGMLYN
jgi:hypothetical protein